MGKEVGIMPYLWWGEISKVFENLLFLLEDCRPLVAESQSLTVSSNDADAICFPSGENATALTPSE